jgi:hypothetical protein
METTRDKELLEALVHTGEPVLISRKRIGTLTAGEQQMLRNFGTVLARAKRRLKENEEARVKRS